MGSIFLNQALPGLLSPLTDILMKRGFGFLFPVLPGLRVRVLKVRKKELPLPKNPRKRNHLPVKALNLIR
jgi:hypothetical protein